MSVSVVLVAYHGDKWLPACLGTLTEASVGRLHLVLVDNAGNTIIDQLDLSDFAAEVLRTPEPLGFAEANNYALMHAGHLEEVILFLNQDTVSPSGWVDACVRNFGEDASLGALCPLICAYDGDGWDPSFLASLPVPARAELERDGSFSNTMRGGRIYTGEAPAPALLVRTDVLARTGPFDAIFGSYYEDYDLCRRIREAGYHIAFCTEARVRHFSGSGTDTPEKEMLRMQLILRNRLIHRLRSSDSPRALELLTYLGIDVPRRLLRGLARTPSSQPPRVTLGALSDLWKVADRLVSEKKDQAAWAAYLDEIGWSQRVASLNQHVAS